MTRSQIGIRFGVHTYQAAVNALRESNSWPLLVFLPLGICSALAGWNPVLTLFSNLLSIIPLSALVSNAADLLSAHVGDLVGGLINATFGNTVELSVCSPLLSFAFSKRADLSR
jgi:Ca2+:H+ antiporter